MLYLCCSLVSGTGIFADPCSKALSRDIKIFMKRKGLRPVPTLYAMQASETLNMLRPKQLLMFISYHSCITILHINIVVMWCDYVSEGDKS